MRKLLIALLLLSTALSGISSAETGVKKRRPLPFEYGRVVMDSHPGNEWMAPVVFDHWLHRSFYTCRVCHVDIGFAMKAGETGVSEDDNIAGYYCGACHNGKMEFNGRKVFAACSKTPLKEDSSRCERCHSQGRSGIERDYEFAEFTKSFPKGRFGNGIDWDKADEQGLIKPSDFVEGISIKRDSLKVQKDFSLVPKVAGMPQIIFSHKKHTVWAGCELCHPEIFIGVKKGATKYSMVEIFDGKYCGACHGKVAFPLTDCQRCHAEPVGQGQP